MVTNDVLLMITSFSVLLAVRNQKLSSISETKRRIKFTAPPCNPYISHDPEKWKIVFFRPSLAQPSAQRHLTDRIAQGLIDDFHTTVHNY